MKKLIKPIGFLVLLILFCSVVSRTLTGGETLEEYAQNNPDVAYATPDRSPAPTEAPTVAPTAAPTAAPTSSPEAVTTPQPKDPEISFYYEPLSENIINRITGISYPVTPAQSETLTVPAVNMIDTEKKLAISYDDLRYLSILYYDFNGEVQQGELICNKGIAQDLLEIFYELYLNEYQIEKVRLIDEYGGDDTASMLDNNTSCFNYRVVDGTTNLSKHAIGCAIDINPFYNPYIVFNKDGSGKDYISPEGSEIYADRSRNFPYKIDENDLCYKLFKEHGFTWGGEWNSCKDYQHFQKVIN